MSITRQQAETVLIRRVGGLLTEAGLDGTSRAGQNKDLNDPITSGLLKLGHTSIVDISDVTDTDLAAVTTDELDAFLTLAEHRALQNIQTEVIRLVDVAIGPRREALGRMSVQLEKRIAVKKMELEMEHGIGSGALEIGVINADFATKGDDTIIVG